MASMQQANASALAAYNTFPSMNGNVVPPEIMMLEPWYLNPLYNMATVQDRKSVV